MPNRRGICFASLTKSLVWSILVVKAATACARIFQSPLCITQIGKMAAMTTVTPTAQRVTVLVLLKHTHPTARKNVRSL